MCSIWYSRVAVVWCGRLKFTEFAVVCVFTVTGVFAVVGEVFCSSCIFSLGVQYMV